jgi:hypothetical protein
MGWGEGGNNVGQRSDAAKESIKNKENNKITSQKIG